LHTAFYKRVIGNPLADPWEPAADPLWDADPSLKTDALGNVVIFARVPDGAIAKGYYVRPSVRPSHVKMSKYFHTA